MIVEQDSLIWRFMGKEVEKLYFTSDTHFQHANIIKHCGRPFASVEEHDAVLVENWNKKRKPKVNSIGELTYKAAIIIGVFQLIAALFPGTPTG